MEYGLKAVQRRRKLLNMTQQQLARAAEVSQSLIAKIENGSLNDVAHSTAMRIFETLEKAEHSEEKKAKDVMVRKVYFAEATDCADKIKKLMKEKFISQVPVLEGKTVIGSVNEDSLLYFEGKITNKTRVSEVMAEAPPQVSEGMPVSAIKIIIKSAKVVLVSKNGNIIGIITKADLI